jgi:hypothetical protein
VGFRKSGLVCCFAYSFPSLYAFRIFALNGRPKFSKLALNAAPSSSFDLSLNTAQGEKPWQKEDLNPPPPIGL